MSTLKALMHVCCACCRACGSEIESKTRASVGSREMPVKAQLQDSMIARCLDIEHHSLVPFLIDGFVFAMPGLKARMNPTVRLHAFAEIRHIPKEAYR